MSKSRTRSPRTDTEYSREKKLSNENKRLKQEVSRARKQLSRIDMGWCPKCLEKYEQNDEAELPPKIENIDKKKDRTCFKCNEGKLVMFRYNKAGEDWYFRKCDLSACKYRTKGKKMTPEVEE